MQRGSYDGILRLFFNVVVIHVRFMDRYEEFISKILNG